MIFLSTPASVGLGQDFLNFSACGYAQDFLKGIPVIGSVLNNVGCCTDKGKKALESAIKTGLDQIPGADDPTSAGGIAKAVLAAAGTSAVRDCLCSKISCAGCTGANCNAATGDGKSNTALYVGIAAVAAVAVVGLAMSRRKR